jgi:hypothetical protein
LPFAERQSGSNMSLFAIAAHPVIDPLFDLNLEAAVRALKSGGKYAHGE